MDPGVVDQVAHDAVDPARVRLDHDGLVGKLQRRRRQAGGDKRSQPSSQVDRSRLELLRARVEAGHFQEVLHQGAQSRNIDHQQLRRPPSVRWKRSQLAAEERGFRDEAGQGCPQLVGHVRDEAPVPRLGGPEPLDRCLQRPGHPVELCGPSAELVARVRHDPRVELPVGDPPGDTARGIDRTEDPAGDGAGRHERQTDQEERACEQGDAQLSEGAVDIARVMDEVERRLAGSGPTGEHQGGASRHGRPQIGDLATVDDRADLGREAGERSHLVERGDDRVPVAEVHDRLDIPPLAERLEQAGGGE